MPAPTPSEMSFFIQKGPPAISENSHREAAIDVRERERAAGRQPEQKEVEAEPPAAPETKAEPKPEVSPQLKTLAYNVGLTEEQISSFPDQASLSAAISLRMQQPKETPPPTNPDDVFDPKKFDTPDWDPEVKGLVKHVEQLTKTLSEVMKINQELVRREQSREGDQGKERFHGMLKTAGLEDVLKDPATEKKLLGHVIGLAEMKKNLGEQVDHEVLVKQAAMLLGINPKQRTQPTPPRRQAEAGTPSHRRFETADMGDKTRQFLHERGVEVPPTRDQSSDYAFFKR